MHLVNVAFCAIILSGPVLAQNYPGCKGGVYALIGKDISKYPPAQTYCSSKFPVPAQTSTILASTSTKTSTVTAYTTTTGTVTVTTTYSTTTSTSTNVETNTQTDTATVTATVTRNAKRAADPTSDKWKSVLSQASSFIGAVCTCIENPKTTSVTTTPLATKTATFTSTVGVTSTSTVSVVATTSTVTTSTTTTTITMTVTATVTAVPKPDYNECAENDFCSSQPFGTCYCYASPDGQGACYVNGGSCGQQGCNVNDDCPGSSICITGCQFAGYAGGCSVDDQAIQCRTSQPSAKFLFARGSQLGKVRDRGVRDVNYLPYHEPPAQ